MEFAFCVLVLIIILLIVKARGLSKQIDKNLQDHKNTLKLNRSQIDSLEQEKSTLQHDADKYLNEISDLKKALQDAKRKLDFYENIQSASGELNVPSDPVHGDSAQLDQEQAAILEEIENGYENFFITGKAGTGKSFLLDAFRNATHKSHIVLAPTGIAAQHVNGVTLHSAFGYYNLVNLDIDHISSETIRLKSEKQLALRQVSTIIIDEISMVRADTFDKIDRILKVINNINKPFGGKQLLLFGDLFQLPPIAQAQEQEYLHDRYGGLHFFSADAYIHSNFHFRELTINHRQKEDAVYFELLNRIRDGSFTPVDIDLLNTKIVRDFSVYDRFATLLPTKAEVERLNQYRISLLDSKEYVYRATITKNKYPNKKYSLDALLPITDTLRLKKGVLVMMVSNDPSHRWVNGTLGIVSELSSERISVAINEKLYDIHPVEFSEQDITYKNGKLVYEDVLTVVQYPIVPAYAITIHKSQGQTYQNIVCDINKCFADGQAYVALSRCSSLNGLHLTNQVSRASIRVDRNVLDFYHRNISQDN